MYNLHLFLLRYKWYRALVQNELNCIIAKFVVLACFAIFLFLPVQSLLRLAMLFICSLTTMYFTFILLQTVNNEDKLLKLTLYINIAFWTVLSCQYGVEMFFLCG